MSKMLSAMTRLPIRLLSTLPGQWGRTVFQKQMLTSFFSLAMQEELKVKVAGYFKSYLNKTQAESWSLAEDYLEHYLSKITDDVMLLNWPIGRLRARLEKMLVVRGVENLHKALGSDRGVILLGSHIGSVFLGTLGLLKICLEDPALEKRGLSVCSEPEMASYPLIHNWAKAAGKIYHASIEVINVNNAKGNPAILMIGALKKKRLLTTNMDVLDAGGDRGGVCLLNTMQLCLPALSGALECAYHSGAMVLPWFNIRDGRGKLKVIFERPLDYFAKEDSTMKKEAWVMKSRKHMLDLFQKYLETYPDQWLYWDRLEKRLVK
ncbi:MAG: hypothetical protein JXR70_08275 [Spirochaetales bacterium]|nr:hypothetical protein [Spirochaetales bacterium]